MSGDAEPLQEFFSAVSPLRLEGIVQQWTVGPSQRSFVLLAVLELWLVFGGEEDAPPPPAHVLLVRVAAVVVHALERRLRDEDGFLRRLSRQRSRRDEVRQAEFFQPPPGMTRSYPVREGFEEFGLETVLRRRDERDSFRPCGAVGTGVVDGFHDGVVPLAFAHFSATAMWGLVSSAAVPHLRRDELRRPSKELVIFGLVMHQR